ncbi:alpha amylase C-terminal domain-containing protein [Singulisphaera rosea]
MYHVNNIDKVVAFRRWDQGGAGDDVIVVANFSSKTFTNYRIGLPAEGTWKLRLNSDWNGYSPDFANTPACDMTGHAGCYDHQPCHGEIAIGPYSVLIFSQDR